MRRGDRARMINVTIETAHGSTRWRGPVLGADNLRTLQVVVAMAGTAKYGQLTISARPETDEGCLLRRALRFAPPETPLTGAAVQCTWGDILRESGQANTGGNFRRLRESLERLEMMIVRATIKKDGVEHEAGFSLLGWRRVGDRLGIALNPTLAEAVLGEDARFCRIELHEIRRLKTEAGRLIHQRLCAIQNQGTDRNWKADTLATYIWPEHKTAGPAAKRQHLTRLRQAVGDLRGAGWAAAAIPGGYTITRPARREVPAPSQTAS